VKDPRDGILTLDQAVAWAAKLRAQGNTLAVTNGCFDLLHLGHLETLWQARQKADALLVLVNSDASVRQLKGDGRPINPEFDRAFALASLRYVDQVVVFPGVRCAVELAALRPDVYVKSGQYQHPDELDPQERLALGPGCILCFLQPMPGYSTTRILARAGIPAIQGAVFPPLEVPRA